MCTGEKRHEPLKSGTSVQAAAMFSKIITCHSAVRKGTKHRNKVTELRVVKKDIGESCKGFRGWVLWNKSIEQTQELRKWKVSKSLECSKELSVYHFCHQK